MGFQAAHDRILKTPKATTVRRGDRFAAMSTTIISLGFALKDGDQSREPLVEPEVTADYPSKAHILEQSFPSRVP